MVIEVKRSEPMNESVECEPVNEATNPIVGFAVVSIITTGLALATAGGVVYYAVSTEKRLKDAINAYPEIYKDCKPINSFKKKTYTIKPFSDDPDTELTDKEAKKADNWIHKHNMDRVVLYFEESNDEPSIGYVFRSESSYDCTTNSIKVKIFDKSLEKHKDYYLACFARDRGIRTKDTNNWAKSILDIKNGKKPAKSTNESFFPIVTDDMMEPVNEAFGLSKEEKEKKAADRKALSDLEFSYDKKYNAFCLSVSGYSVDRLQSMLDKKSAELEDAKAEKKSASDRQSKLSAQIKIDYLENVCNRCKAMIKKKKSYEKK